jgi:hypothetical protein
MALTKELRQQKLVQLIQLSGYESSDQLFAAVITDSVSPGLCTTPGCDYTTEVEPDQDRGWCECCGKQTVASALVLASLI